jgi:hypothetical protein
MHWSVYLQNGYVFDAIVDHYALVYMVTRMSGALQNQRLLRLCLDLQNFAFRVIHRKGRDHWDADAISRLMQIDEVARVHTIDTLRSDTSTLTEEERHTLLRSGIRTRFGTKDSPEYGVLLERMACVIETQDTEHETDLKEAWMQERDYRNVVKILAEPVIPIASVGIMAPSLASQIHGGDVNSDNAAGYGVCKCAGQDKGCEVCRWVSVWAPQYAKHVQINPDVLVRHMCSSIRLADRLGRSEVSNKARATALQSQPEAVLRVLGSSGRMPMELRVSADTEFVRRQELKQYPGHLRCMPSTMIRSKLQQCSLEAKEQGQFEEELQRRETRCACTTSAEVHVMALGMTRQAERENASDRLADPITRSGRVREGAVSLNVGGGRQLRLDLERQQEAADNQERKRVRAPKRAMAAEKALDMSEVAAEAEVQTNSKTRQRKARFAYGKNRRASSSTPSGLPTEESGFDNVDNADDSVGHELLPVNTVTGSCYPIMGMFDLYTEVQGPELVALQGASKAMSACKASGLTYGDELRAQQGLGRSVYNVPVSGTPPPHQPEQRDERVMPLPGLQPAGVDGTQAPPPTPAVAVAPGRRGPRKNRRPLHTLRKKQQIPVAEVLERDLREGRIEELVKEALTTQDHLVQLHYLDPVTQELMEVTNTFEEKVTGVLMATSIVVDQQQQIYSLKDVRHKRSRILGEGGIAELVTAYGQSRIGSSEPWPSTDNQWLTAQLKDEYWAEVAARLVDPTMMIPLTKTDDIVDYLYRAAMPDGTVGPIRRRIQMASTLKHSQFGLQVTRTYTQMVVPRSLVLKSIEQHHELLGHPGQRKTLDTCKLSYYWPDMVADIWQHCHDCNFCAARKDNVEHKRVPMEVYDCPFWPWSRIHIDLCTELPVTKEGYTTVLVVKCVMSKWVKFIPIRSKGATDVAVALASVLETWGVPDIILSDRGTEFQNSVMTAIREIFGYKHIKTTAISPQGNGQAEAVMKVVKTTLASFVQDHQRDWSKYLGVLKMSVNGTVNTVTGYSPYFLMTGREMSSPTLDVYNE